MDDWTTALRRGAALLFLAVLGSLAAPSPGSGQFSPRCSDAEYRALNFWVDNSGVVLRQTGGWTDSAFHWQAERRGSDGVVRQLRVTLTPMEGGVVRQLQERSEDEGVTWSVIFDGRYHPVETIGR